VKANWVQPRSSPSHFKIRPSATPVYGPSPLLSKTRLSGPTAPVTWSNLEAWRVFFDPGMGTGEKGFCKLNEVKMMAESARKVAERIMLEFMFMFQDKRRKKCEKCRLFQFFISNMRARARARVQLNCIAGYN